MKPTLTVPLLALVALAALALYFHERRHAAEVAELTGVVDKLIAQREHLVATGAFNWNAAEGQWECDCVREWRARRDAWLKSFEARP